MRVHTTRVRHTPLTILRDWMLDLEAGVEIEEGEGAVVLEPEVLDGAGVDVAHLPPSSPSPLPLPSRRGLTGAALVRVELAALLHDVDDYKYSGSDECSERAVRAILREEATELLGGEGPAASEADRIVAIIDGVSFHGELAGAASAAPDLETACVQDADRLDAIGAIGIARCFTFGGARGRALHDPAEVEPYLRQRGGDGAEAPQLTREAYMARSGGAKGGATLTHFYEKLLTLKGRMKTASGRKVAEGRHAVLEAFVEQFLAEWDATR